MTTRGTSLRGSAGPWHTCPASKNRAHDRYCPGPPPAPRPHRARGNRLEATQYIPSTDEPREPDMRSRAVRSPASGAPEYVTSTHGNRADASVDLLRADQGPTLPDSQSKTTYVPAPWKPVDDWITLKNQD